MDPALAALMGLEEDSTVNDLAVAEPRNISDQCLLDSPFSDQEEDLSDSGSAVIEHCLSPPSPDKPEAEPIPSNTAISGKCVSESITPYGEVDDPEAGTLSFSESSPEVVANLRVANAEENEQLNETEGTPKHASESSVGKLTDEEIKALEKKNRLDRLLALRNRFLAESAKKGETQKKDESERYSSSDVDSGDNGKDKDTARRKKKSMTSATRNLSRSVSPESNSSAAAESNASDSEEDTADRRKSGKSGIHSPSIGFGSDSNKKPRKVGKDKDTARRKKKSMTSATGNLSRSVSPENNSSAAAESNASDSEEDTADRRKSGKSGTHSPSIGSGSDSNKKPRKVESASERQLLEMHKESERLIRFANVSLNSRVVQKKGMSSFLEKLKCSTLSPNSSAMSQHSSATPSTTSRTDLKGKGPMISPINATQASTSKFTRSTPYLNNKDSDTSSSSDVEIVGGPGQVDPNAHLPKAQRVLAKIQPCRSTLMPPQARAALSGRQKYRELAGLKSPKRQPAPYSHDHGTQSSADAVKAHNARLRKAIWEQAAMRRKKMEEEAKAKGLWRSQAEPVLVDADVPREAVAIPMEETQNDDDYIPSSNEEDILESDYSSDQYSNSDDDDNPNKEDQRDGIETKKMEDNIDSGKVTLDKGVSSDEEEPLHVRRRLKPQKALADESTTENKAKSQNGKISEEDEVPLFVRRRTNQAPSIAGTGKGNDENSQLPPANVTSSPKELVEQTQDILDDRKLTPDGFAALFAPSNNLPADELEETANEGETQAWEKLRGKSPGSTLPYSMASAMFPPTIPCDPPSVPTAPTHPNESCIDLDETDVFCGFPPSSYVVGNEDDSLTMPSQYLNSQGLLTRVKPNSLRLDDDEVDTEKSGIRSIFNSDEDEDNREAPQRRRLKPRRSRTRTDTNSSDMRDSLSQIPSSQNGYQVDDDSERSEDEDEDEDDADGQEGIDSESDISETSPRGKSVRRRPNAFLEEEAEEEEDEYMGLGGQDGDGSDDDGEDLKDMIEKRKIGDDELRANDVRDLHRKQLAEEEEKTVAQLMKDLDDAGGGLLRKRRGFDGGLGFGMESDSDDDGRSGRRRAGKRTKNEGPPNPLEEDPRTAAFARAQRGPADEDDPFASDDDNSGLRVTALGRVESTRDVIEIDEVILEEKTVKKSYQEESSFSRSVSFRLSAEEDDDAIESQNSVLLSIVNDRSLLARSHSAVVASSQVQPQRRRLLGCSPSKLQRFRSMGSEEASGANSSIGSHMRSRVNDDTAARNTTNKHTAAFRDVRTKENIEPPPLRDIKGKGPMEACPDRDDIVPNPARRKRGGLLRLLEGRQGFEGDG